MDGLPNKFFLIIIQKLNMDFCLSDESPLKSLVDKRTTPWL